MLDGPAALLALWNDVDPTLETQYNEWHALEHVPERCRVPGILWGLRYARIDEAASPRYLTLYGLRDAAVPDSEPYQRLLREPTPMSQTMRPALRNVSRWVCRVHRYGDLDAHPQLAVWALAQRAQAIDKRAGIGGDAGLLAERLRDASPLPWLRAQRQQDIDGDWLVCAARIDTEAAAIDAALYSRLLA